MDENLLSKLKKTELEILDQVAEFCFRNRIQYSLAAGTALGAVRHKGFIPWDDDVDITMTRLDFMRFRQAWRKNPVKGLTLQFFLDDRYCGTCHAKVRKDRTVLLSEGEDETKGHHGVWIDIFPMDKISKDHRKRKKTLRKGFWLVLLTRANVKDYSAGIIKKMVQLIITMIPYNIRRRWMLNISEELLKDDMQLKDNYDWVSMSAFMSFGNFYDQHIVDSVKKIEFEGKEYQVYQQIEDMLTILYGDYMVLPPVEKRVSIHNPVKVVL